MSLSRPASRRRLLSSLAGVPLLALLPELAPAGSLREDVERVIRGFYRAVFEERNLDAALDYIAEDCRFEDPTFHLRRDGRPAIRTMFEQVHAVYPELRVELDNAVFCSPWAVTQQMMVGRHRPPGGTADVTLRVRGASIFRVEGGCIRTWTDYYDYAGYKAQGGP
jgi:limonene-1,2-epoxide hydrolase